MPAQTHKKLRSKTSIELMLMLCDEFERSGDPAALSMLALKWPDVDWPRIFAHRREQSRSESTHQISFPA